MPKQYIKGQWVNHPSLVSPINETNLMRMENGIDNLDTRSAYIEDNMDTMMANAIEQAEQIIIDNLTAGVSEAVINAENATNDAIDASASAEIAAVNANTAADRANQAAQDAEDAVAGIGVVMESSKGQPGGVASLDETGKVHESQLPPIASTADKIDYDNSASGLNSTNTQGAIDEVSSQLAEKAKQHWIDVTNGKYGAKGDGITDDTVAFTKAVADIVDGSILYLPPRKYLVTPSIIGGINVSNKNNFTIIGFGATVFNNPILITNNSDSTRLFRIDNCSNFSVKGIRFLYQIDWNSNPTSEVGGLDQAVQIYADVDNKCENFEIAENTFEYNGPSLNYYPSGVVRKLTILGLASLTSAGNYPRNIKNFSVRGNTFVNCLGRVIYCLGTQGGVINGNKFTELGKFVNPGESVKYFAESVGIRVLASKDVNVSGNTISCYSGVLLNGSDMGRPHIFVTGSGGYAGVTSENINFTGNTVNVYKSGVWIMEFGACDNVSFTNNNINVDDTTEVTYGLRISESGVKNIKISENKFKNLHTFYYLDDYPVEAFSNVEINENQHTWGNNSTVGFSSTMEPKVHIGINFWSDKNARCKGFRKIREIFAYRIPPLTGSYTRGDICYNTGFDEVACPVVSWVYRRNDGTKNLWSPYESMIPSGGTPPTVPTDANEKLQFVGLQFLDTSSADGSFGLYIFNGVNWVKPDGTVRT